MMLRQRATNRRPAYAMIELLVVVSLLGVLALLAGQAFVACVKLMKQAESQANDAARLDAAVRALRQDVWGAGGLRTDGTAGLRIEAAADQAVTWRFDPATGLLRRTPGAAAGERQWALPRGVLRFEVQGPGLALQWRAAGAPAASRILLASQRLLAREGQR